LARHLAPSGKSVLILERGDWLKREQQNWDVEEVFIKNRYVPRKPGTTNGEALPARSPLLRRRPTKMYGAALYRLRKKTSRD